MKIIPHGAADGVTGPCHKLVSVDLSATYAAPAFPARQPLYPGLSGPPARLGRRSPPTLGKRRNPLAFANPLTVDNHNQHLAMVSHLSQSARPAIVIAASGMCSGGSIVNYLKTMFGDQRHNVLLVGPPCPGLPWTD